MSLRCVRSTTYLCRPSFSELSTPFLAMRRFGFEDRDEERTNSGEYSEAQVAPDLCKRLDPTVSPRADARCHFEPHRCTQYFARCSLVPVTYVAYLYERLPSWDVPLQALAVYFLWGGVLGTVLAGALSTR